MRAVCFSDVAFLGVFVGVQEKRHFKVSSKGALGVLARRARKKTLKVSSKGVLYERIRRQGHGRDDTIKQMVAISVCLKAVSISNF